MPIVEVKKGNFEEEVLKSETPVLVDFYTPYCGPCKLLAPVFEKFSDKLSGKVKFVKVDASAEDDLRNEAKVSGVPTVVAYRGGVEVSRNVGFAGERGVEKLLAALGVAEDQFRSPGGQATG